MLIYVQYNNYFVISQLDWESPECQLAMFKHTISDDGRKVIKSFTYSEGENANDWRVVMNKMEKHCHSEINKIMKDIVSTKGSSFLQKQLTVTSLS